MPSTKPSQTMSTTAAKKLNALVIGGTSGIGQGVALALAKRGYNVTIAGRSPKEVLKQLEDASTSSEQQHSFCAVDGFDLKSFGNAALPKSPDVLVMTQGMATMQGYTPTPTDGLDQKLQLHYFSRIHVARLLAPTMPENAKILSVLSAGVHSRYEHFEQDFTLEQNYSIKNAADAAGLYNDAGLDRFAQDHPSFIVAHASPGFVNTNWGTEMPWYLKGIIRLLQPLGRSQEMCGQLLTTALLDSTANHPGFNLFDHNGNNITNKRAPLYTKEERDLIWEKTLEVLPDV